MKGITDQHYLSKDQYRDASHVNRRFQLHDRFSTNTYGWHPWVFDQFKRPLQSRLLELGCGPGHLWAKNAGRIPRQWEITLSDFSPGMLQDARRNLQESSRNFRFVGIDAQRIPFEDETFDTVIANHMLYHIPDRRKACSEIRRVLKSDGKLYATANGRSHLRELGDLIRRFDPGYTPRTGVDEFSLENGWDQLSPWFSNINLVRYDDALIITDAHALVSWAKSWAEAVFPANKLTRLFAFLEHEFTIQGSIHVTKDSGMFVADKGQDM